MISQEIKKKRCNTPSKWRWHIDKVFVKINGKLHYLWRAIDHEGTVLDYHAAKRRNRRATLKVLKKLVSQRSVSKKIETDKLLSYRAALRDINMVYLQETKQYANNQVENSYLHSRRREKAIYHFRSMKSLQKFIVLQSTFKIIPITKDT